MDGYKRIPTAAQRIDEVLALGRAFWQLTKPRVVALLVSPERLRSRRAQEAWQQTDALCERLARARSEQPEARFDAARADELAQAIDDDRSAR